MKTEEIIIISLLGLSILVLLILVIRQLLKTSKPKEHTDFAQHEDEVAGVSNFYRPIG